MDWIVQRGWLWGAWLFAAVFIYNNRMDNDIQAGTGIILCFICMAVYHLERLIDAPPSKDNTP